MTTIRYQALAALSEALGRLRRRSRLVERVLDVRYSPESYASIEAACRFQDVEIGEFYRWKCLQWASMIEVLRLNNKRVTEFLCSHDRSSYEKLDNVLQQPRGILIATPHYGHFLVALAAIADHTAGRKTVNIFFDPPDKHPTNLDFAKFCERRHGAGNSVKVIYNNRTGLVSAIKSLRRGEVVIIMPDVFENIDDTFELPFLGHSRSVALGAGTLARISNSIILPMVSKHERRGDFNSVFGDLIGASHPEIGSDRIAQTQYDYALLCEIFSQFECLMGREVIPWQYSRDHFNAPGPLPIVPPDKLDEYFLMFTQDPRVMVDLSSPIVLD